MLCSEEPSFPIFTYNEYPNLLGLNFKPSRKSKKPKLTLGFSVDVRKLFTDGGVEALERFLAVQELSMFNHSARCLVVDSHHTSHHCIEFRWRYACKFLVQYFSIQLDMEVQVALLDVLEAARENSGTFIWSRNSIEWGDEKHPQRDKDDGQRMLRSSFNEVGNKRCLSWENAETESIHSLQLIFSNTNMIPNQTSLRWFSGNSCQPLEAKLQCWRSDFSDEN